MMIWDSFSAHEKCLLHHDYSVVSSYKHSSTSASASYVPFIPTAVFFSLAQLIDR